MRKTGILLIFSLLSILLLSAQNKKVAVYSIAFYNLENLFDTIHQEGVNDYEFTPTGTYKWNNYKYYNKLNNLSHAISQLALQYCPEGPAVIGVSEVENRSVLEDLVRTGRLADRNYQIVHYDSPDRRGIDVGLLYNPDLFELESSKSFRLNMPEYPDMKTRDPLLVTGRLAGERFHFIVNHWPSRLGGQKESSPKREGAAALVKQITDSLLQADPESKVVIMGDLNDDPGDRSTKIVLNAKKKQEDVQPGGLYSPFWSILDKGIGTLAYKGNWNLFDQIIISSNLLGKDRSDLKFWKAEVFNRDFLKQQEGKYKGYPKRTHAAGVYLNGYSDHFPTIIYLVKEVN